MRANKFSKRISADGQHYFCLIAGNGEVIATSEMYKSKSAMLKGIKSVQANAGRFETLALRVEKWAKDKGILDNATLSDQALKTWEEAEELLHAATTRNADEYRDALGDCLVTLIIGAKMSSNDLIDCLEDVLQIIEKRTGKMENGMFVKDK